jgi:hypothetical protein
VRGTRAFLLLGHRQLRHPQSSRPRPRIRHPRRGTLLTRTRRHQMIFMTKFTLGLLSEPWESRPKLGLSRGPSEGLNEGDTQLDILNGLSNRRPANSGFTRTPPPCGNILKNPPRDRRRNSVSSYTSRGLAAQKCQRPPQRTKSCFCLTKRWLSQCSGRSGHFLWRPYRRCSTTVLSFQYVTSILLI